MRQWLKDFVHNCIVHPALMFLPKEMGNRLHDRNADWAWGKQHYNELKEEGKK